MADLTTPAPLPSGVLHWRGQLAPDACRCQRQPCLAELAYHGYAFTRGW